MAMEQMTLLDFMTHFLKAQSKDYLVHEILRLETQWRQSPLFVEHWERLAENCCVELVNHELPPREPEAPDFNTEWSPVNGDY